VRYQIQFTSAAHRQLISLPKQFAARIDGAIQRLANDPHPNGAEKLKGGKDLYRIRVGDYRVVYTIEDARLLIVIIRIVTAKMFTAASKGL
jgi:mRNA interferase RelE/StbE